MGCFYDSVGLIYNIIKPTKARECVLTQTSLILPDPLNALEMRKRARSISSVKTLCVGNGALLRTEDTPMQFKTF